MMGNKATANRMIAEMQAKARAASGGPIHPVGFQHASTMQTDTLAHVPDTFKPTGFDKLPASQTDGGAYHERRSAMRDARDRFSARSGLTPALAPGLFNRESSIGDRAASKNTKPLHGKVTGYVGAGPSTGGKVPHSAHLRGPMAGKKSAPFRRPLK